MKELAFTSIRQLKEKLSKKEISSKELLKFFINRFIKHDPKLNSAVEIFDEESILSHHKPGGQLDGIPGLIKDNICQKTRITSAGSKILSNYRATYDATSITKLKNEGALLIGRANCDEFAMGSSNETSYYGKVHNPWDLERVPGGSSGGSAAAVAAGLIPWALGSETGGSVRQPAAFCGVVGSKPTYGLISRYGLIAYASSLDQIGVITKTVYDNALVLSIMAGKDEKDSTTLNGSNLDFTKNLDGKIKPGIKIGIIENALNAEGIDNEVASALQNALKELEKLGAKIEKITLPTMDYSAATYFILSRAEAASNLARFDGIRYGYSSSKRDSLSDLYEYTRREGFGDTVRTRILVGNYVLSVGHAEHFYQNAKIVQSMMRQEFNDAFKNCDLLFAPVHPTPAFKFGAFAENKLAMDLQDYFTCSANLTGLPAVSIPCGFTKNNLPIGFQLIGPNLSEDLIFKTAYAYEQSTQLYMRHPNYD
ncbi:Asp-tRNA(Asn)/Glu-tRNA(Gln) amidotransferase subunit GatA [Candidatus Dependentiae bacterium]|nr:Asp-tRNA(Asn)/Glu-tRNA(Gln) amidotransferase subunit GatA [Candidatus Dependentiae bacterium]